MTAAEPTPPSQPSPSLPTLKAQLAAERIVVAPGVYDALGALVAERAGFTALYLSGASIAYGRFGRPDIGLVSMTEVADTLALIRERVALPLVVDADTGYGNALNVMRTVRRFERCGAGAIQLEDIAAPACFMRRFCLSSFSKRPTTVCQSDASGFMRLFSFLWDLSRVYRAWGGEESWPEQSLLLRGHKERVRQRKVVVDLLDEGFKDSSSVPLPHHVAGRCNALAGEVVGKKLLFLNSLAGLRIADGEPINMGDALRRLTPAARSSSARSTAKE
ncbi:MAG: isocitrate lyase/PEP mutase family protein [Proteobacteria bacterium]|nr:isocitrate lyase/PEP mutase family protein [Pseudomonadota bacterium]